MKITRIASYRWPYSFKQRIHGKDSKDMPELVKPESEITEGVLDNILRWEDDGGPVFETDNPLPQAAENKTPRPMDMAGDDPLYDDLWKSSELGNVG